jgi:hypothetical protein
MNYHYPRDERFGGLLLPFLAGVAVTTPFVFFAKNQNQYPPMYPPPYYPMPYYPVPGPIYYR